MNIISHKQVHPMRWKRRPLRKFMETNPKPDSHFQVSRDGVIEIPKENLLPNDGHIDPATGKVWTKKVDANGDPYLDDE